MTTPTPSGGKRLQKERLAGFNIRNADSDVIEHSFLPMDDAVVRSDVGVTGAPTRCTED